MLSAVLETQSKRACVAPQAAKSSLRGASRSIPRLGILGMLLYRCTLITSSSTLECFSRRALRDLAVAPLGYGCTYTTSRSPGGGATWLRGDVARGWISLRPSLLEESEVTTSGRGFRLDWFGVLWWYSMQISWC